MCSILKSLKAIVVLSSLFTLCQAVDVHAESATKLDQSLRIAKNALKIAQKEKGRNDVQEQQIYELRIGKTGSGSAGANGASGSQGPAGSSGAPGPVGPQGAVGPTGATGVPGPIGPRGIEGATGASGTQGAPGATGASGAAGPVGATGPVGAPGLVGATGPTGPQGTPGSAGTNGNVNIAASQSILVRGALSCVPNMSFVGNLAAYNGHCNPQQVNPQNASSLLTRTASATATCPAGTFVLTHTYQALRAIGTNLQGGYSIVSGSAKYIDAMINTHEFILNSGGIPTGVTVALTAIDVVAPVYGVYPFVAEINLICAPIS